MSTVVDFINQAWNLALEVQKISGPKLVEWRKELEGNQEIQGKISTLKQEIETFALKFPLPGHDDI